MFNDIKLEFSLSFKLIVLHLQMFLEMFYEYCIYKVKKISNKC